MPYLDEKRIALTVCKKQQGSNLLLKSFGVAVAWRPDLMQGKRNSPRLYIFYQRKQSSVTNLRFL
jgi:hypothetical protein